MIKKKTNKHKQSREPLSNNFFASPHGGRPPSDEVVHKATRRYILQGWLKGITPSKQWRKENKIFTRGEAVFALAEKEFP